MSNDLPDLPSDEDLGIDEEELSKFLDIDPDKMSPEELAALFAKEEGGDSSKKKKKRGKGLGKKLLGLAGGLFARKPAGDAPPAVPPTKPPTEPAPPRDEGRRSRWLGPVTLGILIALSLLVSTPLSLPSPVAANAPEGAFSSSRAMADVVSIARAAHPTGSPEHARVREFILQRLRDLGLDPEVQTTTTLREGSSTVRAATVRNVLARIPGTASSGAIVVTAHYDGAGIARAAGDDGAGVVTILETLRALRAGPPLRNDVIVLITDAEELGLMGARAFVDEHPWMDDVALVVSVEMRGGGGPSVMFETGPENGWIIRALQEGDPRPFANSLSLELYRRLPNDTDFTPFREANNLSEATLQHHGLHVLGMMRHLGQRDLATVDAPDVTYFRLPFFGLMAYGGGWVLPLTGLMLLLAAAVLGVALRRGARVSGLVVGLGLGILLVVLIGVAHSVLFGWVAGFHPEYGALAGSAFHVEGWYVLGLAALAFALTTGMLGLARTRFSAGELAWGALLLPVGGAVALSVAMPMAAMNLQWPAVAALVAVLLADVPGGRLGRVSWIATLVLAWVGLAIVVPLVELVWQALSFAARPHLGGLLAVTMLLFLPALDRLREPNSWWAPLTGLVLAVGFTAVGIALASPSASRPQPTTLLYALDRQSGEAMWITDVREGPLAERARGWAQVRTGASFEPGEAARTFGYNRPAAVAAAPAAPVPPLDLEIVSDSVEVGVRRMRVAVRSAVGAELLAFDFGDGESGPRLRGVNGRELDRRATRLEHWGEPDGAVLLDLEVPAERQVAFVVVEHHLRPEDLPGVGTVPFMREPHLAPNVRALSDRALLRTVVGGEAAPDSLGAIGLDSVGASGSDSLAEPSTDSARAATDSAGVAAADTLLPDTAAVPDTVVPDTGRVAPRVSEAGVVVAGAAPGGLWNAPPTARPDVNSTGVRASDELVELTTLYDVKSTRIGPRRQACRLDVSI
jgi:hypothetical protein